MSGSVAITVSYDGSGFAGFARQAGLPTVQGRVEDALRTIYRREILTVGAGRTDAGVHALGQVISFEIPEDADRSSLVRSLNALTGAGIVVTGARSVAPGFSARHSAIAREYRYRIAPGPVPPLFLAPVAWWVRGGLDLDAMRTGARLLLGEHDFMSFCVAASAEGKPTRRRLDVLDITPEQVLGEHSLVIRVVGNAFLHSMVRTIVGTLVEVGRERRAPEWVAQALAARDRAAAGPTAPAHGLTLWHVTYPDECWL